MRKLTSIKSALVGGASMLVLATGARAGEFNIPGGDLAAALDAYTAQTDVALIVSGEAIRGVHTRGAKGALSADDALSRILANTGFVVQRRSSGAITIVQEQLKPRHSELNEIAQTRLAAASSAAAGIESVVVTSSKIKGDIQTVPIAITALSQEQLTSRQIAGGPDLVKEVPNLTFTKTNFAGYSIQIRGIGTQAISVTTDPAVAVAFNDTPFIRNHFFEQEFYDVGQVEILRGPQGTLYGRNATAGVVNLISAKPTDQFEAMASADIGNYHNRRFEGMINVPIVDDRLDIRVAGEWTKRDGYSFNELTGQPIDGRDLWSSRVTVGWKPTSNLQTYLVWEHFQETDDRIRSAKQLCKTDYGPNYDPATGDSYVDGVPKGIGILGFGEAGDFFSQGCLPTSLYSPDAFQAPLSYALPYVLGVTILHLDDIGNAAYDNVAQSTNLRVIKSEIEPTYRANNDTLEFNADYNLTPTLTLTSQTGYNHDFLWSTEDFNRFGSNPGFYKTPFCDPQLGCSQRLIAEDLSEEHAWQLSQEFRLASNFSGPLNFSAGANYLHYETDEFYYVFSNAFTALSPGSGRGNIRKNDHVYDPITGQFTNSGFLPLGYQLNDPTGGADIGGAYVDPNPITHLNNNGHNYFLSQNPYILNSYATFGEVNYSLSNELKLTGGLRWTDDQKHFLDIPSWVIESGYGYPVAGTVDQQWSKFTGRAVANWTPKLDFTDQTLIYGSYAHGYKAGGANPPGAIFPSSTFVGHVEVRPQPIHPLTFKPEFVDAFELGTKNTLLDGGLTLNGDIFFYNYKGYQISEIVDRTAINRNFDATVKGAELESTWEPAPGLKFVFAGGYEDTRIDNGQSAVDLMDRTAGHPGWFVVKPFANEASNCIFPAYVAKWFDSGAPSIGTTSTSYCAHAYDLHEDPFTGLPYVANPSSNSRYYPVPTPPNYPGFDPDAGGVNPLTGLPDPYIGQNTSDGIDYGPTPNDGAGFSKNLSGNQLPNAPHFTTSLSADYTLPVSEDWAATLHSDFYWQSQSWWRVFNDKAYDKLRGYSNVNAALILTSASGWQVMGYVKNIFDATAITGAFLNSDDTGLTTNVFLTDPRLYGVRVTKNW
ncbi:MAG TPA: TonB-dependent receptor [Rhizomicrobium sp.]|nr:TonB-dependent receptor [Rhizomicrobium sp.]